MERREKIGRALETLDELTTQIYDLFGCNSSHEVRKERLGFWRDMLMRELEQIEATLQEKGVARFVNRKDI